MHEDAQRIRREIAYLTSRRRQIVYSFYYENKPISQIAAETVLPEGTVKWHLNKARHELKEGFSMERKIGRLGIAPVTALYIGHGGSPGRNGGPDYYLEEKLNLNIVYSVYHKPRTTAEIADELGVTPVYLEDRIQLLEGNGFLVRTTGNRYTTYVCFSPETHSEELFDKRLQMQYEAAKQLVNDFVPAVRAAVAAISDLYIPGGNRELFEAAAIFYGIINKCGIAMERDLSRYRILTTDGGDYNTYVTLDSQPSDPDYKPIFDRNRYLGCGSMYHHSQKYPSVSSWSVDTRLCSRQGMWQNNLTEDYEALYEFLIGNLPELPANSDKYKRLRERGFLTAENTVNIMILKDDPEHFHSLIPEPDDHIKRRFADYALESAMLEARSYPPHMQDLLITARVNNFISREPALMVMDLLYENGTFRPLTEQEKVASTLLMFSDTLPGQR